MEKYATLEASAEVLKSLGFTSDDNKTFHSPGKNEKGSVARALIYKCRNGYYGVDVEGGWQAPVVWHGPSAEWGLTDVSREFTDWLNQHFPGWK